MAKMEFVYWKPVKKLLFEKCEFEKGACNNEQIEQESIVSLEIEIQITGRYKSMQNSANSRPSLR
jgi:hypothetical protein